jgi:hypothetical protein
MRLLVACMETLLLKLATTIYLWPGLIALPNNTQPIPQYDFFWSPRERLAAGPIHCAIYLFLILQWATQIPPFFLVFPNKIEVRSNHLAFYLHSKSSNVLYLSTVYIIHHFIFGVELVKDEVHVIHLVGSHCFPVLK